MARLPVIPVLVAAEIQLVLGLPVGIRTRKPRRRVTWHPVAAAKAKAEAA